MKKGLLLLVVIGLIALVIMVDVRRREAVQQLQNLSVRLEQLQGGNAEQSREEARRIVQRVRKLIWIPEEIEPTVATICAAAILSTRKPRMGTTSSSPRTGRSSTIPIATSSSMSCPSN
jgi:hypothetical protein